MKHPMVEAGSWFQAIVRWAVMVEGRGIRDGEEGRRRPRWVETRLAEVVTLDCLGSELDEELEVHWIRRPAKEKISFEHKSEPGNKMPPPSF